MGIFIEVFGGNLTEVDDEYYFLDRYNWSMCEGYVVTSILVDSVYRNISIHTIIMGTPSGFVTDHIDGNKLNNKRENLRICTVSQNAMNKRKTDSLCTSLYKGVRKNRDIWEAYIYPEGKNKHIGSFSNEIAAANAYNYYAKIYFGEYAKFNEVLFMELEVFESFRKNKKRKSKYYGLGYHKKNNTWTSKFEGKYLGSFPSEELAAKAFNDEAIKKYGETYEKLNILGEV